MTADPTYIEHSHPLTPDMTQPAIQRTTLLIVDGSPEFELALLYAIRRAKVSQGRLALLALIDPSAPPDWVGVAAALLAERRHEATQRLARIARQIEDLLGHHPITECLAGEPVETVLKFLAAHPDIQHLVLAAANAPGPGPLVSAFTGKALKHLPVPLTLVPPGLTAAQLAALT